MGILERLEEQSHLELYISRMNQLGVGLGDIAVNEFFWNSLKSSPIDYVTGMSLTFEQANLDYCTISLMKKVGDLDSAMLLQEVLDDEIGHVSTAFVGSTAFLVSRWIGYRNALHGRQPLLRARYWI